MKRHWKMDFNLRYSIWVKFYVCTTDGEKCERIRLNGYVNINFM